MDQVVAVVILVFILLAAMFYILTPFFSEKTASGSGATHNRVTALQLRKVNLYRQIREAEFEREMGLINEADFRRTKADLVEEVADVMGDLNSKPEVRVLSTAKDVEAVCTSCGAPIEPGAKFCGQCGVAKDEVCPSCGTAILSGDRFCAGCGRGLLD